MIDLESRRTVHSISYCVQYFFLVSVFRFAHVLYFLYGSNTSFSFLQLIFFLITSAFYFILFLSTISLSSFVCIFLYFNPSCYPRSFTHLRHFTSPPFFTIPISHFLLLTLPCCMTSFLLFIIVRSTISLSLPLPSLFLTIPILQLFSFATSPLHYTSVPQYFFPSLLTIPASPYFPLFSSLLLTFSLHALPFSPTIYSPLFLTSTLLTFSLPPDKKNTSTFVDPFLHSFPVPVVSSSRKEIV